MSGASWRAVVALLVAASPLAFANGAGASAALPCLPGLVTVNGHTPGYLTIQCAIDNAPSGATISIPAGTFIGQVYVDKPVTLVGAGQGQTVIASPPHDTLAQPYSEPGYSPLPIVYVGPAGGGTAAFGGSATIEQLTVDASDSSGDSDLACTHDIQGIAVVNASATIQDVTVAHVRLVPGSGLLSLAGCQAGLGIAVQNDLSGSSVASTVTVNNDTVEDYQKDGILLVGPNLAFTVDGDTISNLPSSAIATNGLEIDSGAAGSATGDTISGNECDLVTSCGADARHETQAGGVITDDSGAVTLSGDVIVGNDFGVGPYNDASDPASVTLTQSTVSDRYEGVLSGEGAEAITDNAISGGDIGVDVISFGPSGGLDPYSGDDANATVTLTGNTLTGNSQAAIRADDEGAAPFTPQVTARANRVVGNGAGAVAGDPPVTLDVADNWWGCNTGPGTTGCDSVSGVSASPYLQLSLSASPASVTTGGQVSGVTATVSRDSAGQTVDTSQFPAAPVSLASTLGTLDQTTVTLSGGSAASLISSPATPGSATVTADLDAASVTTSVAFTSPPVVQAPGGGSGQAQTQPGGGGQGMQSTQNGMPSTGASGPSGPPATALALKTSAGKPLHAGAVLTPSGGLLVLRVSNAASKAVRVTLALHARISAHRRVVASSTVTVAARASRDVKLSLDAAARARLRRGRLTVTLTTTGAGRNSSLALTLRHAAATSSHRRG